MQICTKTWRCFYRRKNMKNLKGTSKVKTLLITLRRYNCPVFVPVSSLSCINSKLWERMQNMYISKGWFRSIALWVIMGPASFRSATLLCIEMFWRCGNNKKTLIHLKSLVKKWKKYKCAKILCHWPLFESKLAWSICQHNQHCCVNIHALNSTHWQSTKAELIHLFIYFFTL